MFPPKTLYTTGFMQMNKTCPCCGQSFEPEPGFYLGVLYTSYALHAVVFFIILFAFYRSDVSLVLLIVLFFLAVVLLLPITFRLSRSMWIHIFVRYEGPCDQIRKL